jgi:hypothetical protein
MLSPLCGVSMSSDWARSEGSGGERAPSLPGYAAAAERSGCSQAGGRTGGVSPG